MDFLLAWFTKFITLYFLEISQEGMLKFTVKESVSVKLRLELLIFYAVIYVHICEGCGCIKKLLFKYETKLLHRTFLLDCSKWKLF